jgi:hypothetical protein
MPHLLFFEFATLSATTNTPQTSKAEGHASGGLPLSMNNSYF